MADIFDDSMNLADLASRIEGPDRELFQSFKALTVHAAFDDRIFIIYQPQGLNHDGTHRAPNILAKLRCIGILCTSVNGCGIRLENMATEEVQDVGYIPVRPFGMDFFMSVPPSLKLRWDAKVVNGNLIRNLQYALLVKTRSRSDWHSAGATMCETINNFRGLYPSVSF